MALSIPKGEGIEIADLGFRNADLRTEVSRYAT